MNGQCKCCGRKQDLRLGFCFDCAECESIIEEGSDMYDKLPPKIEGMSMSMSKLKHILKKYINTQPNQKERTPTS